MGSKFIFFILVILIFLGGFYFLQSGKVSYEKREVALGSALYDLEIADTDGLRERGLSYREALAPNTGMLFIFDTPAVHKFWMKDMNFSIDIIWLDTEKRVVHIEHSLSPATYPKSFGPTTSTQYVIEIPAGVTSQIGLALGDIINF